MDKATIICVDKEEQIINLVELALKTSNITSVNCIEIKGLDNNTTTKVISDVKEQFLICMDMAGYNRQTLLEDTIYNIMPVKQLHFITNKEIWDKNRCPNVALNQYIALPNTKTTTVRLKELSEDIPNLIEYPTLETQEQGILRTKRNVENIYQVIQTVLMDAY